MTRHKIVISDLVSDAFHRMPSHDNIKPPFGEIVIKKQTEECGNKFKFVEASNNLCSLCKKKKQKLQ